MTISTRDYINQLAEKIIEIYQISVPITDIETVVTKMGGTIEEKLDFDDFCDGTIRKDGNYSFSIVVSKNQTKQRKNFTVAHELGHLFLHMGFRTRTDLWQKQESTVYRRFGTSEQEYQANEFAAALLMPKTRYKEVIDQYTKENRVNILQVANYFHVSTAAASNRGKFLGYLEW